MTLPRAIRPRLSGPDKDHCGDASDKHEDGTDTKQCGDTRPFSMPLLIFFFEPLKIIQISVFGIQCLIYWNIAYADRPEYQ